MLQTNFARVGSEKNLVDPETGHIYFFALFVILYAKSYKILRALKADNCIFFSGREGRLPVVRRILREAEGERLREIERD